MNFLTKILDNIHKLNAEVIKAIAEDFRKIGTYMLGLSWTGWLLDSDTMKTNEAMWLSCFGLIYWGFGIICVYLSDILTRKKGG